MYGSMLYTDAGDVHASAGSQSRYTRCPTPGRSRTAAPPARSAGASTAPKIITARARKPKPATPYSNRHTPTPAVMDTMPPTTAQEAGDQHTGIAHLVDVDTHGVRRLRMLTAGAQPQTEAGLVQQPRRPRSAACTVTSMNQFSSEPAHMNQQQVFRGAGVRRCRRTRRCRRMAAVFMAFTATVAAAVASMFMAVPVMVWSALKLMAATASSSEKTAWPNRALTMTAGDDHDRRSHG